MPDLVGWYHIREQHVRQKRALATDDLPFWAWQMLSRWITGYGEKPLRIVGTSAIVIGVWGLLYPLLGGIVITTTGEPLHVFEPVGTPLQDLPGGKWLMSFYFSVITFTTLGYGDIHPASAPAQILAGLESLMGGALLALLVAVLSLKITR